MAAVARSNDTIDPPIHSSPNFSETVAAGVGEQSDTAVGLQHLQFLLCFIMLAGHG